MISKVWYIYKGEYVKSVRIECGSDGRALNTKDIYDAAPENWDVCKWDYDEVFPMRKKRKKVEEIEEIVEKIAEDNGE